MKQKHKSSMRSWLTSSILLAVSLSISMIIGEFKVRIFMPQDLRFNVTKWDEYLGFWHIPNIEGYTKHRDYTMYVKINSRGLRDREYTYEKPNQTLRIGVFGDSFTFGEGVQNDEAYPAVLERLIGDVGESGGGVNKVEVLNFGVGKTGTSHQYALYEKEGRKYGLDLVVLGFVGGNDFEDNLSGVFSLEGDVLTHNPSAYTSVRKIQKIVYSIPFYRWLAENSHLVNLVRISVTRLDDRFRARRQMENTLGQEAETRRKQELKALKALILTEHLVDAFRARVARDGAGFVVMNIPAKKQKKLQDFAAGEEVPVYVSQTDDLMLHLYNRGIDTLDLVPVFSKLPEEQYYFKNDGHMNPAGYDVIAKELWEYIQPRIVSMRTAQSVMTADQ